MRFFITFSAVLVFTSLVLSTPSVAQALFQFENACLQTSTPFYKRIMFMQSQGYVRVGMNKTKKLVQNGKGVKGRFRLVNQSRDGAIEMGSIFGGRQECSFAFKEQGAWEDFLSDLSAMLNRISGREPKVKKFNQNNYRFDYPGGRVFAIRTTNRISKISHYRLDWHTRR